MTIGPDIKEVITEVGDPVTILREAGDITGESVKIKANAQITKPFIREFFMDAWFYHDTQIVPGDWLRFSDDRIFIVMNRTPKTFEGSVIRYEAVLYKTNAVGVILRQSNNRIDYQSITTWAPVKENVPVLLTEALYGNSLEADEELGQIGLKESDLYIPRSVGIKPKDRLKLSDGECFKVEAVRKRRFENVDLATIGEDTRGDDGYVFP